MTSLPPANMNVTLGEDGPEAERPTQLARRALDGVTRGLSSSPRKGAAPTVTMVIPTIPPRVAMLQRAVASILQQTHPVDIVSIAVDNNHDGAWTTRNRAMANVQTDWLGFLDDDDDLYAHHVATLLEVADTTGAGMVWGWFEVHGGSDPFPENRGRQWSFEAPYTVPITYLVRSDIARKAFDETGGFLPDDIGAWDNQDQPFFAACARIGGTACTGEITWRWFHHGRNTSGLPERWA